MMDLLSCYSTQLKPHLQVPSSLVGCGFFNLITFMMEKEIWKDVEEYDGLYQVSNFGRVRSWNNVGYGTEKRLIPIIKAARHYYSGYNQVHLSSRLKRKQELVHRLVAKAFIPNPENKMCVNHKDGNKLNNHVSNLEWVTHSENAKHAYRNGLKYWTDEMRRKLSESQTGVKNNQSKLTKKEVIQIRELRENDRLTYSEIAKKYGVTRHAVSLIVRRKRWAHIQ